MKGDLFVVIATPKSKGIEVLLSAIDQTKNESTIHFLLPQYINLENVPGSHWESIKGKFVFNAIQTGKVTEWILFLDNRINLADQFESIIPILNEHKGLNLIRILTFLDSNLLVKKIDGFEEWTDACAHFSDVLCFANRSNENSPAIKETIERYKRKYFPIETIILPLTKSPPINRILCPISLRMTHIFDNPEILEPEDSPENDRYLSYLPNGTRINKIPLLNF